MIFSRLLVIALALGAAGYRAATGAWIEAAGLFGLGAGLVCLKLAPTRPQMKPLAFVFFAITAIAVAAALLRNYFS